MPNTPRTSQSLLDEFNKTAKACLREEDPISPALLLLEYDVLNKNQSFNVTEREILANALYDYCVLATKKYGTDNFRSEFSEWERGRQEFEEATFRRALKKITAPETIKYLKSTAGDEISNVILDLIYAVRDKKDDPPYWRSSDEEGYQDFIAYISRGLTFFGKKMEEELERRSQQNAARNDMNIPKKAIAFKKDP